MLFLLPLNKRRSKDISIRITDVYCVVLSLQAVESAVLYTSTRREEKRKRKIDKRKKAKEMYIYNTDDRYVDVKRMCSRQLHQSCKILSQCYIITTCPSAIVISIACIK